MHPWHPLRCFFFSAAGSERILVSLRFLVLDLVGPDGKERKKTSIYLVTRNSNDGKNESGNYAGRMAIRDQSFNQSGTHNSRLENPLPNPAFPCMHIRPSRLPSLVYTYTRTHHRLRTIIQTDVVNLIPTSPGN